jgi:hypothetical protein
MSGEPDDLSAFTRSLANVPPHPGRLDRDALLFAAGRAAGRRGVFWPATAVALATLSVVLAGILATRTPTVVEVPRIIPVPTPIAPEGPPPQPAPVEDARPVPTPSAPSPDLAEGLRQRQRLLADDTSERGRAPWITETPARSADVSDLSSLRLNALHHDRGPLR